jgi:predicted AAA+ superfamily ATPase
MKRNVTSQLLKWKNNKTRPPLIIKGARQVGKTYILKEFGNEHFPHCHYINFEESESLGKIFKDDLVPHRILKELSFYLNSPINPGEDLLIFDEIQHCPRALTSLKYFCEEIPGLAICCAGSLLGLQFGTSSFPVGKVDFLNMYPMTFPEFLQGIDEENARNFIIHCNRKSPIPAIVHSRLWELLKIYFVTGGLPGVVDIFNRHKDDLYNALNLVREKQNNLILAYEADMAKHSGKLNSMHINRLWRNIPAQLGRNQDGSASKFKFKDVIPGIKGYARLESIIDWLHTAGLIIKTFIIAKAQLPFSAFKNETFFKLYLFDTGILGALSKLSPKTIIDYDYGTYKGYFAENFAAQEFTAAGSDELYSWKEITSEVEFLRETDNGIIPIEIKSGWVTQAKSLKVFADKYAPSYRVIMSAGEMAVDPVRKIHRYPLYLASSMELIN